MKTEIYTNLIEAVHGNLDKMYRYVALRKKLLGVDELHMYDVYTPVVEDAAVKIPFEEAKSTVLEALAVLGEDYTDLLKEGFANRWIDVYENQGKRSGAYPQATAIRTPMSCSTTRTRWTACSPWPMRWGMHCTATTAQNISPPARQTT